MADALCGPSNALQNFQKHTSVDRTLQQDRLISRQSPQQDFRSAQGHHAGAIDPEFEAFQAGHAPPQPEAFQRFPAQHAPPPGFAGPAGALPDWAADFQRLHVSSPPPLQQQQQQHFQAQAPRYNQTASWHQDFLQQQQASSPAPQMSAGPSRPMYSGGPMMGFGAGQFAHQQPFMAQQDMNAQQVKQTDPVFDDAAFDSAFDAAAAEILEAERAAEAEVPAMAQADQRPAMSKLEEELGIMLPPENDETLAYMKEHAFGEYCRHQMTEYLPRTGTRDASHVPDYSLASLYMNALEKLQSEAKLSDLAPDPLLERVLSEIVDGQDILFNEQFMFSDRAQQLLGLIQNQQPGYLDQEASQRAREREDPMLRGARLRMFQRSLQNEDALSVADKQNLEDAKIKQLVADIGTESRLFPAEASRTVTGMDIRAGIRNNLSMLNQRPEALLQDLRSPPDTVAREAMLRQQPFQQEQNAEQQQSEQRNNDDEELARTAGQLVDSVSHDTSQKFVQSRFLALMRQLRDHEVRVDGDKIVETTPTSQIPANQQDLDLGRGGGGGGDDSNRAMTGALQNDDHDIGELRA